MGWVKKTFHPAELRGQRILPIIGGGLAAAVETVFLPFADFLGNGAVEQTSTDVSLEGAEFVDMRSVPPAVLAQLRFLDPQAVKVREIDGRKLTPLSFWLSPETGERLVRRPSVDELINQAIGPALAALSDSDADLHNGLVLLELAAKWLPRLTGTTAAKVNKSLLLVPVIKYPSDSASSWAWRAAPKVYFGPGWLDRTQEDMIVEAYGQCPEKLTISRQDFLKACLPGNEETDWVNALEKMGVSRYPKWIKRSPQWRRVTFKAWDNNYLHINESDCPIDVATPWWRPYLEAVRCRKITVRSGQEYDFAEVLWIDGLESERSRPAVFRLMLLHHEYYEGFLRASLARDRNGGDATQPDAFWVHAIKQSGWPIIPSTYGLKAPGEVWLLEGGRGTQNLKRHETLSAVKPEHRRAAKLLGAVGVASLAEPSVERLVVELDRLARRCGTEEPPSRAQSLLAMAQDLYERLQRVYDPAAGPFSDLANRWLPFEQAGRLVGQPAKSVRLAYVDDAPERAPFVRDFVDALHWPIRLADRALTAALRKQLVAEAVTFTSAAPACRLPEVDPTVLRTAIGLRAHFGTVLGPLAIKALLLHGCDDGGHDKAEVGWGRIQEDVTAIVTTDQHTAHIVYQGELRPASWTRMQIPVPAETMNGLVEIKATFCYASATDPQDPLNYTRSGLEVRFRPHDQKRKNLTQLHADSSHFFQFRDVAVDEFDLRADAHKWETTLHKSRSMRGANLRNPVFDVHYNARTGGHNSSVTDKMPYALVISVCSAQTTNVYNKIIQRYQTFLEPLTPVINIPIRT